MKKTTGFYPRVKVDTSASGAVGQAGGVLLTQTVAVTGLGRDLTAGLAPWRKATAVHDPAKVITDLAITLALGVTAWPIWRCCGPSPGSSGRWHRTRRSRARSPPWPPTPRPR